MGKVLVVLIAAVIIIGLVVALWCLQAWVCMLGWNAAMPSIFDLPLIGFKQAFGLVIVAWILTGPGAIARGASSVRK